MASETASAESRALFCVRVTVFPGCRTAGAHSPAGTARRFAVSRIDPWGGAMQQISDRSCFPQKKTPRRVRAPGPALQNRNHAGRATVFEAMRARTFFGPFSLLTVFLTPWTMTMENPGCIFFDSFMAHAFLHEFVGIVFLTMPAYVLTPHCLDRPAHHTLSGIRTRPPAFLAFPQNPAQMQIVNPKERSSFPAAASGRRESPVVPREKCRNIDTHSIYSWHPLPRQ